VQRLFSPASIQIRLGDSLGGYAQAVKLGDLEAASNCLELARGDVDPLFTEKERQAYAQLPGYAIGDPRSRAQVLRDMEAQRRFILRVASDHGIYTRAPEEVGDAASLDDPIPEA